MKRREPPNYAPPPSPTAQVADTPLFGGEAAPEGWPQRPPAPQGEQRTLPLPGTLQAAYTAWRGTEDGERVFRFIQSEACADARAGAARLSIDALFQAARRRFKVRLNDHHRALLVRELEEAEPSVRGRFETRKRTAL